MEGFILGFPKRVDENQKALTKLFRDMGASVAILSDLGKGCPDILLGYKGQNFLVEIKNGKKPPSGQKLTEPEQKFFDTWKGQVCIVKSDTEAVDLINSI